MPVSVGAETELNACTSIGQGKAGLIVRAAPSLSARVVATLASIHLVWICEQRNNAKWFDIVYGRAASSFDPQPFNLLQGVLTVLAVYMTAVILSTQRRADELASHREQLTLELATLAEQKSAKTIALLEELRRDSPTLPNRVDEDADAMAASADPGSVLQAIIHSQAGLVESVGGSPTEGMAPEVPIEVTTPPK